MTLPFIAARTGLFLPDITSQRAAGSAVIRTSGEAWVGSSTRTPSLVDTSVIHRPARKRSSTDTGLIWLPRLPAKVGRSGLRNSSFKNIQKMRLAADGSSGNDRRVLRATSFP